jgi:hypothetical protein
MPRERATAAALFAALALALFAPALFGGLLFFPAHSERLLPWRTQVAHDRLEDDRRIENPSLTDKLWLFDPDTSLLEREYERGALPTWNPSVVCGAPLLGQALYGALYPPNLLLWRLLPLARSYAVGAALHVFLAALGAFVLARRLGVPAGGALLAGLLFAAGGAMVVRFHYYMTFYPVAWVPWLLVAVHAFTERPTALRLALVPPPIALAILTGFPQTALYGIVGAGLFGAWRLVAARRARAVAPLLALGGAFALGAVLCAAQVLPFDEAARRSLPRTHSAAQQVEQSGSPWMLAGYVVPDAFQDAREPWSLSIFSNPLWNAVYCRTEARPDGSVLPAGVGAQPNPTETSCYAGAVGFVLALFGLFASQRERALERLRIGLALALIVCWAYALGCAPLVRLVALLPRMDVGEVRRVVPTTGLLVALLAALGARVLLDPAAKRARRLALALALAVAVALGASAAYVQHLGAGGLEERLHGLQVARYGAAAVAEFQKVIALSPQQWNSVHAFVVAKGATAAGWFVVAGLALLIADRLMDRSAPGIATAVLALACVADLGVYHFRTNPFVAAEGFLAPDPLLAPLAAERCGGRVDRYEPDYRLGSDTIEQLVLPPNLGARFGIDDFEGYIVMVPTRLARYRRALEPEQESATSVATVAVLPLRSRAALVSPLLDVASVRYVLTRRDLLADLAAAGLGDGGFALAAQRGEARVYENREALPFATIVPEALLLPAAPADDAIAVAADAEPLRRGAESDERARLQAAALQDQAGAPGLAARRVVLEADAPADDVRFARATHRLTLAGGAAVEVATLALRGAPSRVASIERTATRVVVRLAEGGDGGFLRLSEGFDPGWTATADGRPLAVLPADVAFRGAIVPAGAREIVFDYRPGAVAKGFSFSGGALALWAALAVIGAVRRRRPAAPPDSAAPAA